MSSMLSIGIAAKMLGVCIKTLRRWDGNNKIKCYRTVGNHRRFSVSEINRFIGNKKDRKEGKKKSSKIRCALHGRVSSYKQKKRGDLDVQIKALEQYCKQNHLDVLKIYSDIGSGLNTNRKGLWRLIRDVKKGLFEVVIVNYKDRLTRFGFRYLKEYLNEFNVKIVPLNKLKNKALETELVEDLVSIIRSFSGRLYGMRSHQNKKLITSNS